MRNGGTLALDKLIKLCYLSRKHQNEMSGQTKRAGILNRDVCSLN